MMLIITDIPSANLTPSDSEYVFIENDREITPCRGCFKCWIKTPGQCPIDDGFGNTGKLLSECGSLIIVSKLTYGSFSPFVKNVLDRAISYVHPYLRIINNEMHHRLRYGNKLSCSAYFYTDNNGDLPDEAEKNTACRLVNANCKNFGATVNNIIFLDSCERLQGLSLS